METAPQTDAGFERIQYPLWRHQIRSVQEIDRYPFVFVIGGRGSGKSYEDTPRVIRWADMCTELAYGIFATTDTQLQTVLAPIRATIERMGIDHRYESEAPPEWRERWDAEGILYPPQRLREGKFWIWDTGAHFFTGSIINNAYTRAKSIDFNAVLIEEGTEPGITLNAVNTLFGSCRCGKATPGPDGWRCREPNHLHQLVLVGNTPLNDPTHWIYRKHDELMRREAERARDGRKAFYLLLAPATKDNPATGLDYLERLGAAFDARTYEEQTRGGLQRNTAVTSYHAFDETNITESPAYDSSRPLHIWFDFNAMPAVTGMGHDLRLSEVPEPHRRKDRVYHGIFGELFSGHEPMVTEQVAYALLEDPAGVGRCIDCSDSMREHTLTSAGLLCMVCGSVSSQGGFCSGRTTAFDAKRDYLRVPDNWHGLAKHRGPIYVYADATGGATTADSAQPGGSIRILRDIFGANLPHGKLHFKIPSANPSVRMRVLAVNRGLCDHTGTRSIYVHPRCAAHVDDMREVVPDPNSAGDPLKQGHRKRHGTCPDEYCLRTHMLDAFGYHWSFRFPARIPRFDSHGQPYMSEVDVGPMGGVRMHEPRDLLS